MAERTYRTARRETAASATVTSRVVDALMALRALGCARTTDLMRVTEHPSRNAFNKWARKLIDGGLIRVFAADFAEENSYALTHDGWTAVAKALPEFHGVPPPPAREPTTHRLLIAGFWTRVATGVRETAGSSLLAWPEESLRGVSKDGIVPDLLLAVTGESGTTALLVEADAATEGSTFLLQKIERFEVASERGAFMGFDRWRVLWVVNDATRGRFLARTIGEHYRAVEHLIINLDEVEEGHMLTHACDVAGRPDSQSTLAGSVRGKE